jgi:hypothetical protein
MVEGFALLLSIVALAYAMRAMRSGPDSRRLRRSAEGERRCGPALTG